ncbi:PTTG1 interacting protein b [Paramormyrops kingsleyae]|uniref:Pituitary tumor-transforming gene 1 protein-interacting protein-like n=1 Tax=Paramormyrops kingsleyae TaxID=1676925 RepID=A0A3B3RLF8_9TELE|nr:pituitary tumor-transforming gene 1 protein-interacting protein-like [Paramormyrops kingsleyae]
MVELRCFLPVLFVFGVLVILPRSSVAYTDCNALSNTTCEECLRNLSCLWCQSTQICIYYPVQTILPPHSLCPLDLARWGSCWVNFQTLIIAISVVAAVIIIAILICCFCCCKCENIGTKRFENKMDRQAEKRKVQQEERKAEMKTRHEEIRQKYGLTKANPYARFENS